MTTVLTMTFLGLEARTDLPQVSYPTALDYFVFISFMSIFTTVVQVCSISGHAYSREWTVKKVLSLPLPQFALVHFFTKVGGGEYYLEELEETVCLHELKRKIVMEKQLLKKLEEEKKEEEEHQRLIATVSVVLVVLLYTTKYLVPHMCSKAAYDEKGF